MKKFTNIRKMYEQEVSLANLPENVNKEDDKDLQDTNKEESSENNSDTQKVEVQINVDQQPQSQNNQSQPTENKESSQVTPVKLFSKIFESREIAHIYHLQVNGEGSFASHNALNEYYDNVLGLLDELIETYQGQYGILDGYDTIDTNSTRSQDKIAYFEEVAEFIKHARKCISIEDSHLHSIIDDIVVLIYKTLYKLKFLK